MLAPVAFRISDTITPPFPNKQPTWFDGTTSRAVTDDPIFNPESISFSIPVSTDLEKTSTAAFCAGEYLDSGFCKKKMKPPRKECVNKKRVIINIHTQGLKTDFIQLTSEAVIVINRSSHSATEGPTLIVAPVSL